MSPNEPDELSAKLRVWQVDPLVPSDFPRQVWQRIAAEQAARDEAFWPQISAWVAQFFSRPAFAAVIVLLSLGGGVACGRAKAHETNAHSWHNLEVRYEEALNPLVREVDHLNHVAP